ncbi:MAG: XRE family transcriptional regulator [Ktedonobacteraceae bacterium]|nr:XRE family transcriptional regulator [Ktedonobacteraceae bacterium]
MANERLKDAMAAAHVDTEAIIRATCVDPKTVQRWLNGRIPHARHRWKVAQLLNQHEDVLWPSVAANAVPGTTHTLEVIAAYAHRADVPASTWWHLFEQAQKGIDLLANAMLFLPEQNAGLITLFKEKATHGCIIRIAFADPHCEPVHWRDEEEQLGGTLPGRIKNCLYHFRSIRATPGIEIRYHATILYNSLFRADNNMFVTPHLYGLHGSKAPLFHLRRLGSDGLFTNFTTHFEQVWKTTKPIV